MNTQEIINKYTSIILSAMPDAEELNHKVPEHARPMRADESFEMIYFGDDDSGNYLSMSDLDQAMESAVTRLLRKEMGDKGKSWMYAQRDSAEDEVTEKQSANLDTDNLEFLANMIACHAVSAAACFKLAENSNPDAQSILNQYQEHGQRIIEIYEAGLVPCGIDIRSDQKTYIFWRKF